MTGYNNVAIKFRDVYHFVHVIKKDDVTSDTSD